MRTPTSFIVPMTLLFLAAPAAARDARVEAGKIVEKTAAAIEQINQKHAASPGKHTEADLARQAKKPVAQARRALEKLPQGEVRWQALRDLALAAAGCDVADEIATIESDLARNAPEVAAELGRFVSRPRFQLHAVGLGKETVERITLVFGGVLDVYERVFGFAELSKVPGKKLRLFVHREEEPGPPHFAPQFPFHSEIDFPLGEDAFSSPTVDGRFLFYGLCHELGHVVAMWGDRRTEEDHHAWAHYTGVVIVEAAAEEDWAKGLRDVKWRSLEGQREELDGVPATRADRTGVLALLVSLHDLVGPQRMGAAINRMDRNDAGTRVNRVRYYGLDDLMEALLAGSKSRAERVQIQALMAKE